MKAFLTIRSLIGSFSIQMAKPFQQMTEACDPGKPAFYILEKDCNSAFLILPVWKKNDHLHLQRSQPCPFNMNIRTGAAFDHWCTF